MPDRAWRSRSRTAASGLVHPRSGLAAQARHHHRQRPRHRRRRLPRRDPRQPGQPRPPRALHRAPRATASPSSCPAGRAGRVRRGRFAPRQLAGGHWTWRQRWLRRPPPDNEGLTSTSEHLPTRQQGRGPAEQALDDTERRDRRRQRPASDRPTDARQRRPTDAAEPSDAPGRRSDGPFDAAEVDCEDGRARPRRPAHPRACPAWSCGSRSTRARSRSSAPPP